MKMLNDKKIIRTAKYRRHLRIRLFAKIVKKEKKIPECYGFHRSRVPSAWLNDRRREGLLRGKRNTSGQREAAAIRDFPESRWSLAGPFPSPPWF